MKIREIITKKELIHDDLRLKVNELLTSLFDKKQKELEDMLEETAEASSPLTFMYHHDGIGITYYFGTPWGTVVCEVGDEPEDSKVYYKEGYILSMSKPSETTNEQPNKVKKTIEYLDNISNRVGEVITEYDWRECLSLMKELKG